MAFSYAGNILYPGAPPVIKKMAIGATCYTGQIAIYDVNGATNGGDVIAATAVASNTPDATQMFLGLILGFDGETQTYNSTYKGITGTYSTTQGATRYAQVALVTPYTLIHAPICHGTIGTVPSTVALTGASAGGTAIGHAALAHTTIDGYSTVYMRTGASKGQYRKVTTVTSTSAEVVVLPFSGALAVGDTAVIVNIVEGLAHIQLDSQFQAIDGNWATNYFRAYVHELNLEEAGKEYCVFSFLPQHCVIGGTGA
jgi:hypothetical protein